MENLATATSIGPNSAKHTSLVLAVTISLVSFFFAFVQTWVHHNGLETLSKIGIVFNHPGALSGLIAEALGGSLLLPTVHVGVASLFKSMRNPSSRRRIFIGWGIFTLLLGMWTLWSKSRGF